MESEPDRQLINGAAVVLVFLGLARLVVAFVDNTIDSYVGGTVSAIALWAIAGMVFWINRVETRLATREHQPPGRILQMRPLPLDEARRTGTDE